MLTLERSQKAKLANLLEAFKEKHTDVIKHLSQVGLVLQEGGANLRATGGGGLI